MSTLIIWFADANLALIALYLFYRLFLHRDTFFREKRFTFLLGILFALLYPFIDITSWVQGNNQASMMAQNMSVMLPEISVTAEAGNKVSILPVLMGLYLLTTVALLGRMLWQIGSVIILAIKGKRTNLDGQILIGQQTGSAPFSFFGWIFINPEEHSLVDLKEILHHEKVHVKQLHSLDVLFSEAVCCIFWFNPFAWFLKHHMRANLEYLADKGVIHSGFDPKSYQYHLLRLSYQQSKAEIGNKFNFSQLKNRIIMMNKKKTSLAGLCKYALSLPLFALLFLSAYAWSAEKETMSKKEVADKTIVQDDKPLMKVDQLPEFPGSNQALVKYISDNLKYPQHAAEQRIEGRVIIRFVVSAEGKIKDAVVLRGIDTDCDAEALRVINSMPNWKPGVHNGKKVSVYFTIPIVFKLREEETNTELKNPLLIIDNVVSNLTREQLRDSIKPERIESLNVLKDSAAISTYGEKGKNGAIIIKLKK